MASVLGGLGDEGGETKLQDVGAYVVAVFWTLSAFSVAKTVSVATLLVGLASLAVAYGVASARTRRVVRWVASALSVLVPLGAFGIAHSVFRTLPVWPMLVAAASGLVVHAFLLFGRITRLRLGIGLIGSIALGATFRDPRNEGALSAQACDERVGLLERRIAERVNNPSVRFQLNVAQLPTVARGSRPTTGGFVLEVAPGGMWLGGKLPDSAVQAGAMLRSRLKEPVPGAPVGAVPTLYIAADGALAVRTLARLFERPVEAKVLLVTKAQGGPAGVPPAGARDAATKLQEASATGDRALIVADELGRRAGPCPLLAKQLSSMHKLPSEQRADFFTRALSQGLRDCRCSWVDVDALEYIALRVVDDSEVGYYAAELPRDATGRLELPSDPQLNVARWSNSLAERAAR